MINRCAVAMAAKCDGRTEEMGFGCVVLMFGQLYFANNACWFETDRFRAIVSPKLKLQGGNGAGTAGQGLWSA